MYLLCVLTRLVSGAVGVHDDQDDGEDKPVRRDIDGDPERPGDYQAEPRIAPGRAVWWLLPRSGGIAVRRAGCHDTMLRGLARGCSVRAAPGQSRARCRRIGALPYPAKCGPDQSEDTARHRAGGRIGRRGPWSFRSRARNRRSSARRWSLSPSRAADFLTCPLLYRFRVIDRLPEAPSQAMARGTLVHAVLERLFDEPAASRARSRPTADRAGVGAHRVRRARPGGAVR